MNYNEARALVRQFGGSQYALSPNGCEHIWGLLDAVNSLCKRHWRDHTEERFETGQVCAWCLKRMEKIFGENHVRTS